MASPTNADLHHRVVSDSRPQPPPISKEMLFPDSSVPLSPEWLLPKQGENRLGQGAGGLHSSGHNSVDAMKAMRIREELNGEKKKDVYRPSFHDIDGRRDRWHEEEREANPTIRRDRWSEGEKELVDSRKAERWLESSSRHSSLASERWTDSGNRENAYEQRRESKWNTRWGPDVKDSEHRREKWSGKDGESRDKAAHHPATQGKEASNHGKNTYKEEDYHSRSWRLSPPLISERGETATHLPLNQNKTIPNMCYGRGKGENGVSVFSAGRGRATTNSFGMNIGSTRPLGTASERSNCSHGDTPILRYSRMKMLDIYRATNFKGYNKLFLGLVEVPSLMEAEPLEPLAINAPTSDELVILKAIDKGDIVSSGVSQSSKDGSAGKNLLESGSSKLAKSGIMEDATSLSSTCREEAPENAKNNDFVLNESSSFEKHSDFDTKAVTGRSLLGYQADKLTSEAFKHGSTSANDFNCRELQKLDATPLSCQSFGEQSLRASNDERDYSEAVSISSELDWLHLQKEVEIAPVGNNAALSYLKDGWHWQNSRSSHSEVNVAEPSFRRQPSNIVEQEKDGSLLHGHCDSFTQRVKSGDTKLSQSLSPENLRLCYKDPQGHIQGPFSGSDLIGWFEAGYFGIDLQVRLANSPPDAPFSLLGDVIPQLRARVRPPPGFGMGRQNEFVEVLNKGKLSVPRAIYARAAESELLKNDRGSNIESKLQAENCFLESLMLGKTSSSDSESHALGEGIDGYHPIVSVKPSFGGENMSNMNYLVHKMSLEQTRSLPNPYWPVKDPPDVVSSANFVNGYPIPHSKFPQMGEISHHMLQSSNHKGLPSILHPTADKSPSVAISTAPALPNFHDIQTLKCSHGSMDINKNMMDLNQSQQSINSYIGFGIPQNLQTKPQPSLSNLAQLGEFSGGVIAPEKFVTSEFSQDPQIMHLLQQQYMLYQQLHSQVPFSNQNVSPLDLLLLMQRQKHEQQQKQFLLQQQQHLLSQVLSANQLQQLGSEVPLKHLRSGVNNEITPPDNPLLQKFQEELQRKLQITAYGSEDSYKSGFTNCSLHSAQDGSFTSSSEHSQSYLPNQTIEHISQQNLGDANGGRNQTLNSIQSALTAERLPNELNSPNQIFEPITRRILTVANDESAQNSLAKQSVLLEECLPSVGEGSAEEAFLAQKNALDVESYVASEGASQPTEIVASAAVHENILVLSERNTANHDSASSICENINDANVFISPDTSSKQAHVQKSAQKATKGTELQEVKNASEKKCRKQKNSQIRAVTPQVKESSKASPEYSRAKLDTREAIDSKKEQGKPVVVVKTPVGTTFEAGSKNPAPDDLDSSNFVGAQVSTSDVCLGKLEVEERKFQGDGVNVVSVTNVQLSPNNLAWKPAQGQKAKSLLEIQQEEQQKVQINSSSNNIPDIMPMNDSVRSVASTAVNSAQKYVGDTLQVVSSTTSVALNPENLLDSINMIGNSHSILFEEISAKLSEARDITGNHENGSLLPSPKNVSAQTGLVVADDDDFVEAKDNRRIRRSRKNKSVVVKASKSLIADDSSNLSSISGKTKPSKVGLDEEFLPVPAVPSLGDFVFWKGDQSNSVPAPAWSADPIKLQKPTSLRDILREQQNKTNPNQPQIQASTLKAQPSSSKRISSLQASGPSPSKGLSSNNSKPASPIQSVSSAPGLSKMKTEDDFFWGPLDQAKNEARSDFPTVADSSSSTVKGKSAKMAHGDLLNRKPSSGRASEHSSSFSSSQSLSKGIKNKNATSKHSEAMDFRDWCEREWFRLTGTNDTSFIEFCLKQRSSEAEALLKENLGLLDCNHEFIDKFINCMEFLSPQVLESAFLGQTVRSSHTAHVVSRDVEIEADNGVDGSSRGGKKKGKVSRDVEIEADNGVDGSSRGGKKKGKKGKKLNPAILGFNVVSNRIMMGEIQTVEE